MKLKDLNKPYDESELCKLGKKHKTDKPANGYTRIYYELLKDLQNDPVDIFEIGIYLDETSRTEGACKIKIIEIKGSK